MSDKHNTMRWIYSREKQLLIICTKHGEKACGNCKNVTLDKSYNVECQKSYCRPHHDPGFWCDKWEMDVRFNAILNEAQMNNYDLPFFSKICGKVY